MPTYREWVHQAQKQLKARQLPQESALVYLCDLAQMENTDLYLRYEEEMDPDLLAKANRGLQRIYNHEPIPYILGFAWFYGERFMVNRDVLIPRPETEELVAAVLRTCDEYFPQNQPIIAADIGTGCGAIALTLVREEPRIQMTATDISPKALAVARLNQTRLHVPATLRCGDLLEPLIRQGQRVDLLVCNPPYIPQDEVLDPGVYDYEPHIALFGGKDGLDCYRRVLKQAPQVLNPHAFLAFEIAFNQKEPLLREVQQTLNNAKATVLQDINGKDRILLIYLDSKEQP